MRPTGVDFVTYPPGSALAPLVRDRATLVIFLRSFG
jgi:hypothetical protein